MPRTRPALAARPGTTLSAPGKDLTFLPAEPGHLRFREDLGPDAAPAPLHRHLRQTERFTALEGHLRLTVAGRAVMLAPGESAEVPPGVAHSYAPGEDRPVLIEVELWPVRDGGRFFETIYGMTRDARLPPRGLGDVLALAAFCHAQAFYLAALPLVLQRPLAAFGAACAALWRIESWSPRYAAQAPAALPPVFFDLAIGRGGSK